MQLAKSTNFEAKRRSVQAAWRDNQDRNGASIRMRRSSRLGSWLSLTHWHERCCSLRASREA